MLTRRGAALQILAAGRALKSGRRIHMRPTLMAAALAALACLIPAAGEASGPAARSGSYQLEVLDEAGRALPAFARDARSYVLGSLGQRYLLRLRNGGPRRVEAVVSVDGRDVIDGGPAGWMKRGYLLDPGGEIIIDGYRLTEATVAAFRFSSVPRSYAALVGDARDVGVIGVAVFTEREHPRLPYPLRSLREPAPRAEPSPGARVEAWSDAAPSAPRAERGAAQRPGLGTEFGEEHDSPVQRVSFERASTRPDAQLAVRYDDREGLLAAGVDVDANRWARHGEVRLRETAEPFRRSGAFAEPPPGWRSDHASRAP